MRRHELKILPKWYADVESEKKNFEIRVNDRNYKVGDTLILQEYDKGNYTGREITRKIQYIYQGNGAYGLSEEYCILGLDQEPCDKYIKEIDHLRKYISKLETQIVEQEPCDNAISRQAMLDGIEELKKSPWATDKRGNGFEYLITEALDVVAELCVKQAPPVKQEPKTGHWIYTDYHTWCCSECGGNPHRGTGFVPNKDGMKMRWKYCNLCGAKMIEAKGE